MINRSAIYRPEVGKVYLRHGKAREVLQVNDGSEVVVWRNPRGYVVQRSSFVSWATWIQTPFKVKKKPMVRAYRPRPKVNLNVPTGEQAGFLLDDDIPF